MRMGVIPLKMMMVAAVMSGPAVLAAADDGPEKKSFEARSFMHIVLNCKNVDPSHVEVVALMFQDAIDRAQRQCADEGYDCSQSEPATSLRDEPDGCRGYAVVDGVRNRQSSR